MTAGQVARKKPPSCAIDEPLAAMEGRFTDEHQVCVVLSEDGVFLGKVSRAEAEAKAGKTAGEAMQAAASTFRPDVHIMTMYDWFQRRKKAQEFVITTPDGRVWGVLYRRDVEELVAAASKEHKKHARR